MLALADELADRSFDYIICGGGTAGLTLAARLTEDPEVTVLVLEAGEANLNDPAILRSASYGTHFGNPIYDWSHKTVPQEHCNGREFTWPRGKGLGGSSAINFLGWSKPPASEIDDFERLGNPGWNWKTYQYYAHKTETFTHPSEQVQTQNKMRLGSWGKAGTEGPLLTAFPAQIATIELDVQQTLINCGIPIAADPLNGDPKGCSFLPSTLDPVTHMRTYAASAYYVPNADRPNWRVAVSALVTRAILEKTESGELEATGVEIVLAGRKFVVKAKKEVIFSAGGLKSSQLLELSGIGDSTILERLDIPVRIDLPSVGENVQEHTIGSVSWELKDSILFDTLDILRDPKVAEEHIELLKDGQGAFTMGITDFAFVPLEALSPRGQEIHDMIREKIHKNADTYPPGLLEQYEIQLRRIEEQAPGCELISIPCFMSFPHPPKENRKYVSIFFGLSHNFSRGSIHVTSDSPEKDPAYDPRYFSEECDLQTALEMAKFTRKLAEAEPLKSLLVEEVNPGPNVTTDEQLTDWIKSTILTTYHTAGACSMLPRDKGGVVDPRLKVYGTTNLRVVDLSIVPLQFAAHPIATVYAIAEKAADIIKGKI